jgi:hypothetical protein
MLTGQSNSVNAGPEVLASPKRRRFSDLNSCEPRLTFFTRPKLAPDDDVIKDGVLTVRWWNCHGSCTETTSALYSAECLRRCLLFLFFDISRWTIYTCSFLSNKAGDLQSFE